MGKILTGFEHVAAKPKGRDPEQEEAPAQESMRGGRTLLANPSTDEKKTKRRIRRNAAVADCPTCDGSGKNWLAPNHPCPECNGSGKISGPTCRACDGAGYEYYLDSSGTPSKRECSVCGGPGILRKDSVKTASIQETVVDDPIGADLWSTALLIETPSAVPVAKTASPAPSRPTVAPPQVNQRPAPFKVGDTVETLHEENDGDRAWEPGHQFTVDSITRFDHGENRGVPMINGGHGHPSVVHPGRLKLVRSASHEGVAWNGLDMATEARLLDEDENPRIVASAGDDLRRLAWSDMRYLKNFMQTLNGYGVLLNYTTDYGTTSAEGILHYDGETATVTNASGTSISVPAYNVLRCEPSENPNYPAPHSTVGPDADAGGPGFNPISPLFHGLVPSGAMASLQTEAWNPFHKEPSADEQECQRLRQKDVEYQTPPTSYLHHDRACPIHGDYEPMSEGDVLKMVMKTQDEATDYGRHPVHGASPGFHEQGTPVGTPGHPVGDMGHALQEIMQHRVPGVDVPEKSLSMQQQALTPEHQQKLTASVEHDAAIEDHWPFQPWNPEKGQIEDHWPWTRKEDARPWLGGKDSDPLSEHPGNDAPGVDLDYQEDDGPLHKKDSSLDSITAANAATLAALRGTK